MLLVIFSNEKIEGMANLSDEAIRNIASVYNSGKLTIRDLEVTNNLNVKGSAIIDNDINCKYITNNGMTANGDLNVKGGATIGGGINVQGAGNIGGGATIGRAYIGEHKEYKDHAIFCHVNQMEKKDDYALLQNGVGDVFFNAPNDKTIWLRNNNIDKGFINKDRLSIDRLWSGEYYNLGNSMALTKEKDRNNSGPFTQDIVNKSGNLDFNKGAGGWDLFLRTKP